jgi:hypothetical protein
LAETIKIPPGMHLDFRRHDDNGSNIVEAYMQHAGPLNGFMGQRFKGYEGQREALTLAEFQEFIVFLANHHKYRNLSPVIIDLFGTTTFAEVVFVPDRSITTHPLADQSPTINQLPVNSGEKPKGNRAKRQAKREKRIAARQAEGRVDHDQRQGRFGQGRR